MNVEAGFFESKDEQDYLVLFFCITTYLCACLLEGSGFFFFFILCSVYSYKINTLNSYFILPSTDPLN